MSKPGEIFNGKNGCWGCSFWIFFIAVIWIIMTLSTATMPMKVGSDVSINDFGTIYNNMCYHYEGKVLEINGDYAKVHWTRWRTFSEIPSSNKPCNLVSRTKISDLEYDEASTIKDHGKSKYYILSFIFITIAVIVVLAIMAAINKAGSSTVNYVAGSGSSDSNSQGGFTPK